MESRSDCKKVLYITRKYPPQIGGMEVFCYNLYNGLKKREKLDINLISLERKQKHLIWFFPYVCLYVLLNVRKYDVLFIGDGLLCFLGVISKFISPTTKRIINVFGLDITFKNRIYQYYLQLFYHKCSDIYISISKETETVLRVKHNINSVVITPGISIHSKNKSITKEQLWKKYNISVNDFVIITVGRLVKRKGVNWFVNEVLPAFALKEVKYLIIGDGEDFYQIQNSIEKTDLRDNALMLGKISQEELDAFYEYSDLFVMPNIKVDGDMEGFGIVAVESSALGTLVLAANIEGIKDAIIDNVNGLLVESADKEAFIQCIKDIMLNKDKYEEKTLAFSRYTREHYSWEYICKQYEKLIVES